MRVECLPCCYHPTEVVLLDDSGIYLETIKILLGEVHLSVSLKFFAHTHEALAYLHNLQQKNIARTLIDPLLKRVDTFQMSHYALSVNLFDLYKIAYNPLRLQQVSTLVVDYDLGRQGTGVKFCSAVTIPGVQKCLCTGQFDYEFAIQAFNKGIIQQFVRKREVNQAQKWKQVLEKSQRAYFLEITKPLMEPLEQKSEFPLAIYCSQFQTYFENLLEKYHIVEYYLLDPVGSYLLIDKEGGSWILFVQNEDQRQANWLDRSEEIKNALSKKEVEAVYQGESIICHLSYLDGIERPFNPKHHVALATRIEDKEEGHCFYCAFQADEGLLDKKYYQSPRFF